MGEFLEVAKVLVSPAEKLIDCVNGAIGKVYEPRHLKKMADAKSYEIKKIGEAMRETSDIPIEYNKDGIMLSSTDYDQFVKRAQNRMAFQELKKQENIETVAGKAYYLLENEEKVTAEPVEQDWMLRFFNAVEDISNEQMQDIWAKILAGEIKKPGTFSMRTLSTLHNLSQREATIFQEMCQHFVIRNGSTFILNNDSYFENNDIIFAKMLTLNDCGLLNADSMIGFTQRYVAGESFVIRTDDYVSIAKLEDIEEVLIQISAYPLTTAGKELARIVGCHMSLEEFKEIIEIYKEKAEQIEFSIHALQSVSDDRIIYDENTL